MKVQLKAITQGFRTREDIAEEVFGKIKDLL